jgi:hypothetical protein
MDKWVGHYRYVSNWLHKGIICNFAKIVFIELEQFGILKLPFGWCTVSKSLLFVSVPVFFFYIFVIYMCVAWKGTATTNEPFTFFMLQYSVGKPFMMLWTVPVSRKEIGNAYILIF